MFGIDKRAASVTWTAALVILLLFVVYTIRGTLFVFTISLLLAYLLYPSSIGSNGCCLHAPGPPPSSWCFSPSCWWW